MSTPGRLAAALVSAFALAAPVMVVLVVADWIEGGPYSGRGSFRIAS